MLKRCDGGCGTTKDTVGVGFICATCLVGNAGGDPDAWRAAHGLPPRGVGAGKNPPRYSLGTSTTRGGRWVHHEEVEGGPALCIKRKETGYLCGATAAGMYKAGPEQPQAPLCQACYDAGIALYASGSWVPFQSDAVDKWRAWLARHLATVIGKEIIPYHQGDGVPDHTATHRPNPYLCRREPTCEDCGNGPIYMRAHPCPTPGSGEGRRALESAARAKTTGENYAYHENGPSYPTRDRYRPPAGFGLGAAVGGAWSYGWMVRR